MRRNHILPQLHFFVIAILPVALITDVAKPQSLVVQLPPADLNSLPHSAASSSPAEFDMDWPPNSMSPRQRDWERRLWRVYPNLIDEWSSPDEVVERLRSAGIPIRIDQSALHDRLESDEPITWPHSSQPLYERLNLALEKQNASIQITQHGVEILSLNVANDPEKFLQVCYDVSDIAGASAETAESLINSIRSTVSPDNWDDANGDATLLQLWLNGRRLLASSMPYRQHLEMRRMLRGLAELSNGTAPLAWNNRTVGLVTSRVVTIPDGELDTSGLNRRIQESPNAHGLGLGGGGFFNVPTDSVRPPVKAGFKIAPAEHGIRLACPSLGQQ